LLSSGKLSLDNTCQFRLVLDTNLDHAGLKMSKTKLAT